ncbi:hypothetical protein OG401_29600 [Kitasatospora purpeofusca]|uniref:hypothetical protein n=1 Tax=Kitasatospora purpeofusca TaxID=67352 RepID=UPI003244116C|nr:hypothetical protein [Kitasatospora purpeofusca]
MILLPFGPSGFVSRWRRLRGQLLAPQSHFVPENRLPAVLAVIILARWTSHQRRKRGVKTAS